MIRKYKNYILISSILIIALWLIKSDRKSSIANDDMFNIKDTSLITKIFLADRNNNAITLKKSNGKWYVNDQFLARKSAVQTLLSTSHRIRIKRPVSKSALDNVVRFISTTGVYVEFFIDDKMVKSYTIGSNTSDHLGTYMLLKDSEQPFIIHIPSFNGFLSPRYGIQGNALDVINWRSNTVFNLTFNDIKNIKYTDYFDSEKSYLLRTNSFKLINSKRESVVFSDSKVLRLLNSFENLNCETFKNGNKNIQSLTKLEELIVNYDTLVTYKISSLDIKAKEDNFTVNRKFATLNNGDLMLIQDYVFNKVLININELTE